MAGFTFSTHTLNPLDDTHYAPALSATAKATQLKSYPMQNPSLGFADL